MGKLFCLRKIAEKSDKKTVNLPKVLESYNFDEIENVYDFYSVYFAEAKSNFKEILLDLSLDTEFKITKIDDCFFLKITRGQLMNLIYSYRVKAISRIEDKLFPDSLKDFCLKISKGEFEDDILDTIRYSLHYSEDLILSSEEYEEGFPDPEKTIRVRTFKDFCYNLYNKTFNKDYKTPEEGLEDFVIFRIENIYTGR